ncbi:MAG: ribose 5-phosphate isomerase B [Dehalococcoidia bacterium]
MNIAVGCDHHGLDVKKAVFRLLTGAGHTYTDFGCESTSAVDYPDIALKVGRAVINGQARFGVLICGTGIGMCIAANKVKGIRAAQCYNAFVAMRARRHNDAQVCCLPADEDEIDVPAIIEAFITTEFEGGRHIARLDKIREIEEMT